MQTRSIGFIIVPAVLLISGCRTLDVRARNVETIFSMRPDCKELGTVNVDWGWWGTTTETINVMKNQTAWLGGNALLIHGDAIGTALRCSSEPGAEPDVI